MASKPPFDALHLYTATTPNGLKPGIALEELGLSYTAERMEVFAPAIKQAPFINVNPNGRIPALKDGELRVFESGAILLYLIDHYDPEGKISYKRDSAEYYEMVSWLMWQMAGLGPMQGQANWFHLTAPSYSTLARTRYMDETKRLLGVLEARLAESPFLAGPKYTIADIASFPWLRVAPRILQIDLSTYPKIVEWMGRIQARPAVMRAFEKPEFGTEEEEEMMVHMDAMRAKVDAMKGSEKEDS